MSYEVSKEDAELALALSEHADESQFELGRLVSLRVKESELHGVRPSEVYNGFAKVCKGRSARTIRYYAETVAHYADAEWEEFYMLSFDHFARAAFLERNEFVVAARYALDWAVRHAEKHGKGNFATADRMVGEFLPQDEIEKRELKGRLRAISTLKKQAEGLPEKDRKMALRLIEELEKIMQKKKVKRELSDEEIDKLLEKVYENAGAKRIAQSGKVTLFEIDEAPNLPKEVSIPGFAMVAGVENREAALLWGARRHCKEVLWLKRKGRVYSLRS